MPRRPVIPNEDGQLEVVGRATVQHRFIEVGGAAGPVRWHAVEGGEPQGEPLVLLHGNPESWRAWEPQIEHFSDRYRVIAADLKGYGQSDKRPGDWRWESVAEELLLLLDALRVERATLIAHDRGCVLADYLGGNHPERVRAYVRMQQICHIWKPENSPQAVYFADPLFGPYLFGDPDYYFEYRLKPMLRNEVPETRLETLRREMSFDGLADAVVRYFQSSSFEKERLDRIRLFPRMSFPVLLLQGDADAGQPRYYFDHPVLPATICFPAAHRRWIDGAGHYTNLEKPEVVTSEIERFLHTL